jgi:hypothetical protein
VAGVTGAHPDLGPELRQLAQSILDRLDPAVRFAAARATAAPGGQSACQQVWCPVCALAALAAGEQHPMLSVIAEHSVALLAVVRAILDPDGPGGPGAGGPADPDDAPPGPPAGGGRYQHIPVTVADLDDPQ